MGPNSLAVFPYDIAKNATGGCLMKSPGLKPSAEGTVVVPSTAGESLDATLARHRVRGRHDCVAAPPNCLRMEGAFAQILDTEGKSG